jgi:hypothetical protein
MKCNKTLGKWCKNKHGASKIIDTLETYQGGSWSMRPNGVVVGIDGSLSAGQRPKPGALVRRQSLVVELHVHTVATQPVCSRSTKW